MNTRFPTLKTRAFALTLCAYAAFSLVSCDGDETETVKQGEAAATTTRATPANDNVDTIAQNNEAQTTSSAQALTNIRQDTSSDENVKNDTSNETTESSTPKSETVNANSNAKSEEVVSSESKGEEPTISAKAEWESRVASLKKAMPTGLLSGSVEEGSWQGTKFDSAFVEAHKPAVRAAYKSEKTEVAEADAESGDIRTVGAITFKQSAQFFVIYAGDDALKIASDIESVFSRRGWEAGQIEMILVTNDVVERVKRDGSWNEESLALAAKSAGNDIPLWRNEKYSAYVKAVGPFVLYALEQDGEFATGAGRSSSFGAQLIVQYIENYR